MGDAERLTEDVFDALLEGRDPSGTAGSRMTRFVGSLREDADADAEAVPTEALATLLSEGIAPEDLETAGILTAETDRGILTRGILTAETDRGILTRGILTAETDRGILTRGILTFSGQRASAPKGILTRGRLAVRAAVTNVAALGLLTKAAAAGAAVTVATAGAGTANMLPDGAQLAFDQVVGRETTAVVEVEDGVVDPIQDGLVVDDDNEANDFGERVSGDATGTDDGEPGVDGREIACERAAENAQACDDADAAPGRGDERGQSDAEVGERGQSEAEVGERGTSGDRVPEKAPLGKVEIAD